MSEPGSVQRVFDFLTDRTQLQGNYLPADLFDLLKTTAKKEYRRYILH